MSTLPDRSQRTEPTLRLFHPSSEAPIRPPSHHPPNPPRRLKKRRSLRFVYERYVKPAMLTEGVTAKHIADVERHLRSWETFWVSYKASTPKKQRITYPLLPGIKREHLEIWRRHLLSTSLANRTVNKYLGTIRTLLVNAENHTVLKSRPRLERLPERKKFNDRKLYFRDQQFDALMLSAASLRWPSPTTIGMPTGTWWQCALVLYRSYGFRVQELLAYERGKQPLTWENICLDAETPNPMSEETNEFGWLFYTPPKTKRFKAEPIYLPLTRYTRAAIDRLAAVPHGPTDQLFRMPRAQQSFFRAWYELLDLAKVKPKIPGVQFCPYHFRKTCATHLSRHKNGLATAVCRWGSSRDHDGEGSREAQVAMDHYICDDMLLRELHTAPWPSSFEQILNPTT